MCALPGIVVQTAPNITESFPLWVKQKEKKNDFENLKDPSSNCWSPQCASCASYLPEYQIHSND